MGSIMRRIRGKKGRASGRIDSIIRKRARGAEQYKGGSRGGNPGRSAVVDRVGPVPKFIRLSRAVGTAGAPLGAAPLGAIVNSGAKGSSCSAWGQGARRPGRSVRSKGGAGGPEEAAEGRGGQRSLPQQRSCPWWRPSSSGSVSHSRAASRAETTA